MSVKHIGPNGLHLGPRVAGATGLPERDLADAELSLVTLERKFRRTGSDGNLWRAIVLCESKDLPYPKWVRARLHEQAVARIKNGEWKEQDNRDAKGCFVALFWKYHDGGMRPMAAIRAAAKDSGYERDERHLKRVLTEVRDRTAKAVAAETKRRVP